ALQFGGHGLDAATAVTDAGADGVDVGVVRRHGDLRALAGLAGHGLDLDGAVGDLGDLLTHEELEQLGRGARHQDRRTPGRELDLLEVDLDAHADGVALAVDLLLRRHYRLTSTEVDEDVALVVDAGDDAGHDVACAILVLLEDDLALGFADLLRDHLFGGLYGDAGEAFGVDRE